MDSDEEAENGNPTTGLFSRSTNMRTAFTSSSHLLPKEDPQIPDDSTLGPERWIGGVKAKRKKKMVRIM